MFIKNVASVGFLWQQQQKKKERKQKEERNENEYIYVLFTSCSRYIYIIYIYASFAFVLLQSECTQQCFFSKLTNLQWFTAQKAVIIINPQVMLLMHFGDKWFAERCWLPLVDWWLANYFG